MLGGVGAALGVSTGAQAQHSENWDRCANKASAFTIDVRIEACTTLLRGDLPPKVTAMAFNNRAIAFEEKRDYDQAIADFTDAIRLAPDYSRAFYNRGTVYSARQDYEHAIADYSEAIRLNPVYVRALKNRGFAYHAIGDNEHANADLNEADRLTPALPKK